MAKLPGWMVYQDMRPNEDHTAMILTIRVRLWHPGYWLAVLKAIAGR